MAEEEIKAYLLGGSLDTRILPVSLVQISTKGEAHNHTPILSTKSVAAVEDRSAYTVPFARIYVDGLIAHVNLYQFPDSDIENNPLFVGSRDRVLIPAITYEASFQYENLLKAAYDSVTPRKQ